MIVEISQRERLEAFFRQDPLLHLYELGDLDPFFWPHTRWWGREGESGDLEAVALLYKGNEPPTLLLFERSRPAVAEALVRELRPQLPQRFYAHLSPGLAEPAGGARLSAASLKMGLTDPGTVRGVDTAGVEPLGPAQAAELLAFYAASYPDSWFAERMLATGQYVGRREAGRLVAVGGVHVYSPNYAVAALGNVATHPDFRGRGLARQIVAACCVNLLETVELIGLNVHADNAPAIACYARLGFAAVAEFGEYEVG